MSSTNVHSEQDSNKYCASAQIIPTLEKGLEIPPKNSKPGPTIYAVQTEETLVISSIGSYQIGNDGMVIDVDSGKNIGKASMQKCMANKEIREQRAPSQYVQKDDKGIEH